MITRLILQMVMIASIKAEVAYKGYHVDYDHNYVKGSTYETKDIGDKALS